MAAKEEPSTSSQSLYIDTNLDTCFAMAIGEEDTVAEVKQKISVNHQCCYPEMGEIAVRSLKVRRKGRFYLLMDNMVLKRIFHGVSKIWCLRVEAASKQLISTQKPLYLEAGTNIQPQVPVVDNPSTYIDGYKICVKHVSEDTTKALIQPGGDDFVNTLVGVAGSKLESTAGDLEKEMVDGGKTKKRKRHQSTDENEGVEFPKPVDSSDVVKTEASRKKKRKKSKIDMDAEPKAQLNANDADKCEQTFNADVNEGVLFPKLVDSSVVVKTEVPRKKDMDADSKVRLHADDTSKCEQTFDADANEGVEFSKPVDSSVVVMTEVPQKKKRSKKSKKDMDADSKGQLHANDADDTSKREQTFDADAKGVGFSKPVDSSVVVMTGVPQTKKRSKKSKKDIDADSKVQLHANDADDTYKREQTFDADANEGVESSKPVDSSVVIKTEVPQKKRRKKSKKDIDVDSKVQLHAIDVDHTANCERTFDTDVRIVEVHEKNSISMQAENRQNLEVCCGGDQVGSAENDIIEVEKVLLPNDVPKIIPETTDAMLKTKDLDVSAKSDDGTGDILAQDPSNTRKKKAKKDMDADPKAQLHANNADEREQTFDPDVSEGVEFSKLADSSVVVKTEPPRKKRKKKSKKGMDADPKVQLHANDADDTAKCGQTFDTDVGTVEVYENNSISTQAENRQNLEVCSAGHKFGSAENDMIEVEKVLLPNDVPKTIPETTHTMLKAKDLDVSATSADGTGDILAQDPSDTRKKNAEKDMDADSKAQLHANIADEREQTFDADISEGVEFSKPVDSSVVVKTEPPQKKRKKKSKKGMEADPKVQLHANDADDTSKFEQTFDADIHAVEVHKKGSISTQSESRQNLEVRCGGDEVGSAENDMINVGKVLVRNDDPKMIPETTDAMLKTKDLDVSTKSVDATGDILARDPSDSRKEKVKKIKDSGAKNNVSAARLENVEGAGDTLAVQGHPGVEPQNGDAILSEIERVNLLKVECLKTPVGISVNNDYQGSGRENTSPNKAKIIRDQETPEKIHDKEKLKSVKPPPSTSNTVTDQGSKQQVEAQDPTDMRKKKAKKTRNSKAKNNFSTSSVEHVEGAGHALVVQNHPGVEPEKSDMILSDTEGVKASNLERLNTLAEGTVDIDHQGSGREDHFVPRTDNRKLVTPAEQLGEMGFDQRKHDKELKGNKKTKMHNVDPTDIISDLEIPQESVDNQVLGTRTRRGSSEISKLQKMRIKPNSSEKALVSSGAVHPSSKIYRVVARKPDRKKTREVGSQKGNNLLAASDTIFDQSSSESYADSDASTMSPSDTSSSSGQSEGEGFNSPANGSYGRKSEENGGNNNIKPQNTPRKNMDLDTILRSSRSYKKAKLTASQSQLDETESKSIEFDLDNQLLT